VTQQLGGRDENTDKEFAGDSDFVNYSLRDYRRMYAMNTFTYTVAFMLPVKAKRTKNFRELLEYAYSMGFEFLVSECLDNSGLLLRAGKVGCTPQEVANLLIALHLLASQRRQDLIIVGRINQVKYQHCLFATLSIEKLRHWSQHLTNMLATNRPDKQASRGSDLHKDEGGPSRHTYVHTPKLTPPMTPVVDKQRVLH
jgi:hypothetical protein